MNKNDKGNQKKVLSSNEVKKIALSGVFAALVFVATYISVPTAIGHVNLGDGVLLAGGFLLGPIGFFQAAIGSVLADLLLNYQIYIPATFVIKGSMGLLAGILLKKKNVSIVRKIIVFVICELLMVSGYFIYEACIYTTAAAAGSVIPNLIQGGIGAVLAFILCGILEKPREQLLHV